MSLCSAVAGHAAESESIWSLATSTATLSVATKFFAGVTYGSQVQTLASTGQGGVPDFKLDGLVITIFKYCFRGLKLLNRSLAPFRVLLFFAQVVSHVRLGSTDVATYSLIVGTPAPTFGGLQGDVSM